MIILVALLSIIFFLIAFWRLKISHICVGAIKTAQSAVTTMGDKSLGDEDRERVVQGASIKLFAAFFSISVRSIMALVVSFIPIYLAHLTGLATIDAVVGFLSRWDVIAVISAAIIGGYFIFGRSKPYRNDMFKVNYSKLDRLLHRVAFSTPAVQLTAADLERSIYRKKYSHLKAEAPIFITSLARAGTTLLLEILYKHPDLATHTYRDMPFVMAPMLWARLSNNFQKDAKLVERAHGDGMQVGYDSPEAFEEILWHAFFPEKYNRNGLSLWTADDKNEDARLFFIEHMKKIIALRRPELEAGGRYLSKNNANIGRLDLICDMFPDASVIVPFRHPLEHAASLCQQHLNFLRMQENDPFIQRYMADIGHYDFGVQHRPILFPLTQELISPYEPFAMDYWVAYWIAAFTYVLERKNKVILLSYEKTCVYGKEVLADLCMRLCIEHEDIIDSVATILKAPSKKHRDNSGIDPQILKWAEGLYDEIEKLAI